MDDIAIIGMACSFPDAPDLQTYWRNILNKHDAVSDPPDDWEADLYFDPSSTENDKIYCKKGGYLGEQAKFAPYKYGIMPSSMDGGEPDHFLTLEIVDQALNDAGYSKETIDPQRTEVILGRGTYINRGVTSVFQHGVVINQTLQILQDLHPDFGPEELAVIKKHLKAKLPPFTAETVPSLVPNVLAGRIANRLHIMGANYIVDAACASSLVAVEQGMRDLRDEKYDLLIVGGVNASIPPPMLMIFCQITALSRKQHIRPFDKDADGTLLGEGIGIIILKRRKDAERDGDRIYACLKGVGIASDGKGLGLLAPKKEGQVLAVRRAYEDADISPQTVGLIEAHGTGIPMGDVTEIGSLREVFGPRRGMYPDIALGSVKSMISHLIPASGMASLIKTALALYHKILPPTLCDEPNPDLELEKTSFYINSECRPWIHGREDCPRRAGINAFGFGGINSHVIMEEFTGTRGDHLVPTKIARDTEVFIFQGNSRAGLIRKMNLVKAYLHERPETVLEDLAWTLNSEKMVAPVRLAMVASSVKDLVKKLEHSAGRLADPSCRRIRQKRGVYFFADHLGKTGKVAFLFPGEGSQYPGMFADLALQFPMVRKCFDLVDRAFMQQGRPYLPSQTIFPLPLGQGADEKKMWEMDNAAEIIFSANQAMYQLLAHLGIRPDALVGHSTGEYSTLLASGMIEAKDDQELIDFIQGVNSAYEKTVKGGGIAEAVLLSVGTSDRQLIDSVVKKNIGSLYLAMDNCPHQVILCGPKETMDPAEAFLRSQGAICLRLPYSRAYHTPLFSKVSEPLLDFFRQLTISSPRIATYSCASADFFPDDPDAIRQLTTSQWHRRVCFRQTIEKMYEDGVRLFVEVGPRGNLVSFVDDILRKKSFMAISSNVHRRSGILQVNHLVAALAAQHVSFNPERLYEFRNPRKLQLDMQGETAATKKEKSGTHMPINLTLPRIKLEPAELALLSRPKSVPESSSTRDAAAVHPRTQIMMNHMAAMQSFLKTQEDVTQAFLQKMRPTHAVEQRALRDVSSPQTSTADSVKKSLPLLDTIISHTPGREVVVLRGFDLDRDSFLRDHTLGRCPSRGDSDLAGLPVIPLTFSMEMMAECGFLLFPGKKLTGMRDIRAYRWIALDSEEMTLRIEARRNNDSVDGEVEVEVRAYDPQNPDKPQAGLPFIKGTMIFADKYSFPPSVLPFTLSSGRPSKWSGRELYEGFMFHGPSLQGVMSMDNWGENGATANLRAMPGKDLFAQGSDEPGFLSDPVVLDAAGQVVAYWTSDHLPEKFHIFPFRLDELILFGPCLQPPAQAECRVRVLELTENQLRSDIDIIDNDGSLRMQLVGWWDRRFHLPDSFYELRRSPCKGMVSRNWLLPVRELGKNHTLQCCLLTGLDDTFLDAHDRLWQRVLACLCLSRRERKKWLAMKGERKLQWLLGRVAAKDAVRLLLAGKADDYLCPADIELAANKYGQPFVRNISASMTSKYPVLSLTHKKGIAAAVAGDLGDGYGLGIDLEPVHSISEGVENVFCTAGEKKILTAMAETDHKEWLLRLWCAKEAAAKASGFGFVNGVQELTMREAERETGIIHLVVSGELADKLGGRCSKEVRVYTVRDEDLVAACCVWKFR